MEELVAVTIVVPGQGGQEGGRCGAASALLRPVRCILSWLQSLLWRRSSRNCTARSSLP